MIICRTVESLHHSIKNGKKKGGKLGFVPTMGALHQGHLSLINLSKKHCNITICSIFVNPTQFNDPKDFEKYPITIEKDILMLEHAGCDILFLPSVQEMYPQGTNLKTHYELGALENLLEGSHRPGHFQGVCQVVHRLLDIVNPDVLFLGQKDYQQCMVIKKLMEIIGLEHTQLIVGETLREPSGLAMSSRNMRLSEEDKEKAASIFQALHYIKQSINNLPINVLQNEATQQLKNAGFEKIDYVSICKASNLQPIDEVSNEKEPLVALVAAFLNGVRLIDNMLLN